MVGCVAKVRLIVCGRTVVGGAIGGFLFCGASLPALANVSLLAAPLADPLAAAEQQQFLNVTRNDRLPRQVDRQVRHDLARRLDVSWRDLTVVGYSRQTWSDSCLGLGTATELCAQALVPGWQVELTDGEQTWVYHTDETAQTMRLQEPAAESASLPEAVGDRILEVASEASGRPESELTLVEAKPQTWDGCLGIVAVDGICTTVAIAGWQVVVASETGSWIYHSDAEGADIRLNETASLPNSPVRTHLIPADQLPPGSEQGVVFKAIVEGGITGSSSQVLLLEDGQVVQFADDQGVSTATELNQLDPEQVQAFVEVVQQQLFSNLHGLNYAAPTGAADYRTITLISQRGVTRYADIVQDQLPSALQQVIQAWEQTISE